MLRLPPPYTEFAAPQGDALACAVALAPAEGAGTLAWHAGGGMVECAVVLEPLEALATARLVLFAGMNALADALAAECPPEKPLLFDWPDALRFDGGLVGGGRLAWPEGCAGDQVPDWLVFAFTLRADADPDAAPPPPALAEEGFEDFSPAALVEGFASHLMVALDEWATLGPPSQPARWRRRWPGTVLPDTAHLPATPTWFDPATGRLRVEMPA